MLFNAEHCLDAKLGANMRAGASRHGQPADMFANRNGFFSETDIFAVNGVYDDVTS